MRVRVKENERERERVRVKENERKRKRRTERRQRERERERMSEVEDELEKRVYKQKSKHCLFTSNSTHVRIFLYSIENSECLEWDKNHTQLG